MTDQVFSGKYIIQEVLAKGGMGVIYKALDRTLHRLVAIKVVHEHLSGDSSFTARFLREARAMARLDHENIVTIHVVEEERGTPFIVMEYLSGSNLRVLMQARKPLPIRTSIDIALQVAEALAYAHEKGIVHRDIKPANILVDSRGRVKLTDFGIAAALDDVSITTAEQVLGTPEYMSPEQARGDKVDGRADLYSLGIVLYEVVVGRHPFGNMPKTAIQNQLLDTEQELRLAFPDSVPSFVKAIIEDLIRRNLGDRTPTARLLVSQLKDCLQTLSDSPESTEEARTILVTPHREGPVLAATLATAVALGGLALFLHRSDWVQAPEQEPSPPSREERPADRSPGSDGDQGTRGSVKSREDKRTEEPAEEAVTGSRKPPRAPQVVSRPPTGKNPFAASRQQLDALLNDFQTAYERQDISSMEQLSEISPDRQMFLDVMSRNYSVINTSLQDVTITNDQATATLIHEELIDKNGEQVAPDQILRGIRISVRKEGDHWGKVLW